MTNTNFLYVLQWLFPKLVGFSFNIFYQAIFLNGHVASWAIFFLNEILGFNSKKKNWINERVFHISCAYCLSNQSFHLVALDNGYSIESDDMTSLSVQFCTYYGLSTIYMCKYIAQPIDWSSIDNARSAMHIFSFVVVVVVVALRSVFHSILSDLLTIRIARIDGRRSHYIDMKVQ